MPKGGAGDETVAAWTGTGVLHTWTSSVTTWLVLTLRRTVLVWLSVSWDIETAYLAWRALT